MAISVLITGASGLVGSQLTKLLIRKGYKVSHLGRSKKSDGVPSFVWDVGKGTFDQTALQGVDVVVHLAGAGVAEKRWTPGRKLEILESRTKSSELLFRTLQSSQHAVKTVVSASAIGYYGSTLSAELFTEEDRPGDDFLAGVVDAWERSVDKISSLAIRVAKIRIGIVFAKEGGALEEMARPVRLFVGSPLGSGQQVVSWIHIDDLCNIFLKAIEDQSMSGAYNAVSPHPASN
ncbi:MAG TPA: TIGR01777 family oxidoreductase, partial [Cyclobacteriaceae bacterium]|nr:TIGR01777 family oxidoreductase [Cyclobacteriaceae bacterium]